MRGDLFINALDAYLTWGVSLGEQSLTALMTPPPLKVPVENRSSATHGKEIVTSTPRLDSREVSLELNMTAVSRESFMMRYSAFCALLSGGEIRLETRYQPGIVYHCRYLSCQQLSRYNGDSARFVLRIEEPNPSKRE